MAITKYKDAFLNYLFEKKRAQKTIDEHMRLFGMFGDTLPDVSAIGDFCWGKFNISYGSGELTARFKFLDELAAFCEASGGDGIINFEIPIFAGAIRVMIHDYFEGAAWRAVTEMKKAIVPIPANTQIDPQFLGGLSNDEFVAAFAALQELVYGIYEGIEQGSPFEWGWPDWRGLGVYGIDHDRVLRALHLLSHGELVCDTLVLDKKSYFSYEPNKPQERAVMLLKGFADHGFDIEGLDDKKSPSFTVSCPDSPNVMRVVHAYFRVRDNPGGCVKCTESCEEDYCWRTEYWRHTKRVSHRFVEMRDDSDRDGQLSIAPWSPERWYRAEFLARTDALPEGLRATHYSIFEDACRVGIWAEPFYSMFDDSIVYGKGTWKKHKRLIYNDNGTIRMRLERVFAKHPLKVGEAEARFPGIITNHRHFCGECKPDCKYRLGYGEDSDNDSDKGKSCCTYAEFYFRNLTYDDVMFVWELFKLDNNIILAKP